MRTLALIAYLSLAALALAGCSDDPERYPDGAPATTSTTGADGSGTSSASGSSTSSSGTTTTGAPGNQPPTGSMAVQVNGTDAAFALNGTDADGDELSWTLAFGDGNSTNGTSLPANVTHSYGAAGNLTAVLTLSDGVHSVNYTANLTVGSGAAGGQTVTGSYVAGTPVECVYGYQGQLADTTFVTFTVDPATIGKPFVAGFATTVPALALLVDFFDSAGTYVGTEDFPPAAEPGATSNSGTVPEGAATGFLSSCGGGAVEVTYTAG